MVESPLIGDSYALVSRIYAVTADFPEAERPMLGQQLRETALAVASQATDAVTTDDPAERQEALRLAAVGCITVDIQIRLAADLNCLSEADEKELAGLVKKLNDGVARERRTVRR